jgi:hypothetical protein
MAAIKQNGMALDFVNDQTPELCLNAVEQNGFALLHVKKKTPELCFIALSTKYQHRDLIFRWCDHSMRDKLAVYMITNICIAFSHLRLPSYILLEIINWLLYDNYLTELQKINQIIRINERPRTIE